MGFSITFIKIGYFCFTTLRHWPLWTALYELIKHFRYGEEHDLLILCWWDENHWAAKWAFKWFHTLLFLLKNRLSYRSFISTWRKSTTSTWKVLLSDSIQLLLYTNWRIPILYTFWRILLSDKFYSSRHHPAYRPVLYICLTHYIPLFIHWRMKIFSEIFNVKRRLTFR